MMKCVRTNFKATAFCDEDKFGLQVEIFSIEDECSTLDEQKLEHRCVLV